MKFSRSIPNFSKRFPHAFILFAGIGVLVLGRVLSLGNAPGEVVWPVGFRFTLPNLCLSRLAGFECATCGVTRSIIALMHGELSESLRHHLFGWLIFIAIIAQIPYRMFRIAYPDQSLARLESAGYALLITTLMLVFIHYSCRQVGLY